jgi:hypothetical protein
VPTPGRRPLGDDLTFVGSDDAVTRRERRRQSDYRSEVLGLPPGTSRGRQPKVLGNYLPPEDRWHNFLSAEAAEYAQQRAETVRRENEPFPVTARSGC